MIFRILVGVAIFAYPFLIYLGIAKLGASFFGSILAVLLIFRASQLRTTALKKYLIPAALAVCYSIAVTVTNNQTLLLLYPVSINLILLYVFGVSFLRDKTLIEEIVEFRGTEMGPGSRIYLKVLNGIWCVFFALNAAISGYVAFYRPMHDWALYNGLVSYVLIGFLILGEVVFRPFYKRAMRKREQNLSV